MNGPTSPRDYHWIFEMNALPSGNKGRGRILAHMTLTLCCYAREGEEEENFPLYSLPITSFYIDRQGEYGYIRGKEDVDSLCEKCEELCQGQNLEEMGFLSHRSIQLGDLELSLRNRGSRKVLCVKNSNTRLTLLLNEWEDFRKKVQGLSDLIDGIDEWLSSQVPH